MERRASQRECELASRLLFAEDGKDATSDHVTTALAEAFERLFRGMVAIVGPSGFLALTSRAVHLAATEFPFLRNVHASLQDNLFHLSGLVETMEGRSDTDVRDASMSVLANFLWLVTSFIGVDLMLQIIQPIWPSIDFREWYSRHPEG